MATIRHCKDSGNAPMLRMGLESRGLILPASEGAGVTPHFFRMDAGVRLRVAEEDAEEALRAIEEVPKEATIALAVRVRANY